LKLTVNWPHYIPGLRRLSTDDGVWAGAPTVVSWMEATIEALDIDVRR